MARLKCSRTSRNKSVLDVCGLPYEFGPLFFATDDEKYSAADTKKKLGETVIAWVISSTRLDKCHPNSPLFPLTIA
jgi:hypothetical protein